MPNRIVRDAILSSERVASLGWPEEEFYRRLMSIVDDFGRYEANPQLLRSRCYPLQTDNVRAADISRWMAACQKAGLILGYEVAGKQYLEVLNFGQQQRSASKYPPPPAVDINCYQAPADAHLGVSVSEGVSEGGGETRKRASPPVIEGIPEDLLSDYMVVRTAKKAGKLTETAVAGLRREADKAGISLEAAIRACCEYGWQGFNAGWYAERQAKASGTSTFAQQAADLARTTVPSRPGKDPTLLEIERHSATAKPMTPEIRQALREAAERMRA